MNVINLLETIIFAHVGISMANFILLVAVLGSMLFMALNFRLGLILLFLMQGFLFIFFYSMRFDMTIIILSLLSTFVLMALSLILSYSNSGGGIR